jgi:RING-type zinc-finger
VTHSGTIFGSYSSRLPLGAQILARACLHSTFESFLYLKPAGSAVVVVSMAARYDDDNNDIDFARANQLREHDVECPICLRSLRETTMNNDDDYELQWTQSPVCGHSFCRPCLDQWLLAPLPPGATKSALAGTTCTLGRCPVCREELSYFEMHDYVTRELIVPLNSPLDKGLQGAIFLERGLPSVGWSSLHFPIVDTAATDAAAATTTTAADAAADAAATPEDDNRSVGDNEENNTNEFKASDSLDADPSRRRRRRRSSSNNNGNDTVEEALPFLNFENVPGTAERGEPLLLHFKSSRYYAPTHTWEGQAMYNGYSSNADNGDTIVANGPVSRTWRFILSFSGHFRHVTQGVMIRTTTFYEADDRTNASDGNTGSFEFINGTWVMEPAPHNSNDVHDNRLSAHYWNRNAERILTVVHGEVQDETLSIRVESTDTGLICRHLNDANANMVAAWDWTTYPEGPTYVGARLEWHAETRNGTTTDTTDSEHQQQQPITMWIRQSPPIASIRSTPVVSRPTAPPRVQVETIPMGGPGGSVMLRIPQTGIVPPEEKPRPTYHADSLWGNTYCQFLQVGLMSLHFGAVDSDEEETNGLVYMSMEHPGMSQVPPLDNGHPLPSRLPCRTVSWNAATRTFTGEIDWLREAQSPWQGTAKMHLNLTFDPQFMCIVSGTIRHEIHDEKGRFPLMNFKTKNFYCNAALYRAFCDMDNLDMVGLEQRLRTEGAANGVWNQILKVATAAEHDRGTDVCTDPTDYDEK